MPEEKFHIHLNYKVVKADRVRSDGQGKPRAILCRLQIEDATDHPKVIRSLVVWQDKNPQLYNKLAFGIKNNQMPVLRGTAVVLNSTSCYYTNDIE